MPPVAAEHSQEHKNEHAKLPKYVKFIFGGAAGMAAILFVQPLDLVKNRMQMAVKGTYSNSFHAIQSVVKNEGVLALYNGLSAGLLRQATYGTARLGFYMIFFDLAAKDDKPPSFATKVGLGTAAGGLGAIFGTPAEIALIRMTSDGRLPPEKRYGYKHAGDALVRIVKDEGLFTLWRGCYPTVLRASVVNAAELGIYSQAKQVLMNTGYFHDNILCHFTGSMIAGFCAAFASLPVDIAKTKLQNMRVVDGKPEYRGAFDVWSKILRSEGVLALWKGFLPYFFRLGPHAVLTFVFLEELNKLYFNFVLGIEKVQGAL